MSGNRSHETLDFSAYDAMSTEELEKILRSDADAPEGEESDPELILHIMEVLVNRRDDTSNTGKTAAQAWEDFQQHYLPDVAETPPKRRRIAGRWLRCLTAAAAAIVLVVCIPLTASAFGWKDIWNIVATWAKETFSFVSSQDEAVNVPEEEDAIAYSSLRDLLQRNNRPCDMVPIWIPHGFVLESIEKNISPTREIYIAHYLNSEKELGIRVQTYPSTDALNVEIEEDILETYPSADTVYYFFSNEDQIQVVWVTDSYECCISGDISLDEAKMMIDSIGKG